MTDARLRPTAPELVGLDYTRLSKNRESWFLKGMEDRAESRLVPFVPITPEERLRAFKKIGYMPHGLFVPEDDLIRAELLERVRAVGRLSSDDERLRAYHAMQEEGARWVQDGVPGQWTGQQSVARSKARFRIVAWGRRGGKTTHAAYEALGVAVERPRSWVWLAAPTMKLADRAFEKVDQIITDLGLELRGRRNTGQDKILILENGSKIEALSLENIFSAAGAAIDFAVIDEAAQVVPEAWYRAILPPLTDRNGQALLISSYEGEGDFFSDKAKEAQADMNAHGGDAAWELFQDASYDVNFYAFPQGRQTPALLQAQKEMPTDDFLEQFGAIAAGSRERVYPEFKEKVHVGDYPYNPDLPVVLTVDPSSGVNPYAVVALQEYPDGSFVIFDELYETHQTTEELTPKVVARPWCRAEKTSPDGEPDVYVFHNIADVICDSARDDEIRRWSKVGFPAYGVPNKPRVEDRIPLYKNMLRDPVRFHQFYRQKVNEILRDMGLQPDADYDMPLDEQRMLLAQVEEAFSDGKMTQEQRKQLRSCAKVRVNKTCVNAIAEHKTYTYNKRRKLNMNYKEKPKDWMDHIMDAVGYYVWTRHRFDGEREPESYNTLATLARWDNLSDESEEAPGAPSTPTSDRQEGRNPYAVESPVRTSRERFAAFIEDLRPATAGLMAPRSYLQEV